MFALENASSLVFSFRCSNPPSDCQAPAVNHSWARGYCMNAAKYFDGGERGWEHEIIQPVVPSPSSPVPRHHSLQHLQGHLSQSSQSW